MKRKLYKFVDIPSNVKDVEIYTTLSKNMKNLFLPLLRRFNPVEPVVKKSVIL